MAQARTFAIRTFLEGIEIDCISCTVTSGLNQACSAQVEIPAVDAAHELLPRTLIHVFWQETSYESHDGTTSNEYRRDDPTRWKLLFAGEVVALGYAKAGGSRSCYLSCQDFSSYWQAAQLYWGTESNSHNSYKKAILMGSTWLRTGANKVSNGSALANLLSARPTSIPTLSGVLGGIVALLEAATGIYASKGAKSYQGVNDFMSQAELRLHLTRMIGAAPADDTSAMFLKYGDMRQYFQRLTASVQSTASFMDLANQFLQKIYHQWTSVAAPPYMKQGALVVKQEFPVTINYNFSKEVKAEYELTKKAHAANHDRFLEAQKVGGAGTQNQPYFDTGLSNVSSSGTPEVATKEHKALASNLAIKDFVETPPANTSLAAGGVPQGTPSTRQEKLSALSKKVGTEAAGKKSSYASARAQNIQEGLTKARGAISMLAEINTAVTGGASNIDGTATYPNHTLDNLNAADKLLSESLTAFTKGAGAPTKTITTTIAGNPRLHSFLFTPDLFMVPPPRCNVLFPDQYMSVQYSRSWLTETTRLWLFGQTTAGTEQMTGYFSPNTDILGGPKAGEAAVAATKGLSFLMNHEIYSGPVPSIKTLGDMNVFKRLHGQNLEDAKKKAKTKVADPFGAEFTGQARYSPNESMQRAANYLFFAERFAGRQMTIEAKFSPHIIPGLPMLLIDSIEGGVSRIQDAVSETVPTLNNVNTGTHYIGVPAGITHTIRANGGAATSIQLQKCRRHNEGVDIFGQVDLDGAVSIAKKIVVVHKKQRIKTSGITNQLIVTTDSNKDAAIEALVSAGVPQTVAVQSVENNSVATSFNDQTKVLAGSNTTTTHGGKKYETTVRWERNFSSVHVGIDPAQVLAKEKQASNNFFEAGIGLVANNDLPDVIRTTTVTVEEIHSTVRNLSFTFEGTTTPPWFASIYLPHNIGDQYYKPMLGCGSVLDQVIQTNKKGETVSHTVAFPSATGDITRNIEIPAELTDSAYSVQQAAEQLSETWVGLQHAGANMPLFTETYNERTYATMLDIMGNQNSGLAPKHQLVSNDTVVPPLGITGFHGNAYGPFNGFKDSQGNPMEEEGSVSKMSMLGAPKLKPPATRLLNTSADPRFERYARVSDYLNQVNKLKASFGSTGGQNG